MKKAFVALLLLALTSMSLMAQIPSGYYDNASGKTGTELRKALHDIIDNHTTISYNNIWSAFWSTDNKGNGVVWDMYSDIPGGTPPYTYYIGQQQCGSYNGEGDCYNREHSWPQSWFNDSQATTVPGRDLHHIFPTDGYVNQGRSNYPFGEVAGSGSGVTTYQNGSKLGLCKSDVGYSGKVFEPIDEYKGDFARAYFYMSTRYYTEDSDWGTSGMTNKSEILPWAINMLLAWSDADPVSQKEIDRNNAVYGIQGNRNPFIDHPEYAHMIWDPNWSGMLYAITCATGLSNGSITAPSSAVEGTMVTLSATPSQGYMLGSWNVYKTGDASTTVTVSGNGTFTMPSFKVTVSATFTPNNTAYNITCATGLSHGSIGVSAGSALSGTTITLSNTPANGYVLYSYYVYKTGDVNTIVYSGTGNTFVMPAFNVTVSASFVQPSSYSYVKVTEAPSDWSGEYILVYENSSTEGYVWTGLNTANCYVSKTISDNTIADDGFVTLTIAPMTGGYSIRIKGGTNNNKYIYGTSGSNGISFGNNPSLNTISYESNCSKIVSNTSVLRYNSSATVFRYYKSSTYTDQQPVQLYKKTANGSAPTHTIQFDPNGSSQSSYTQTVNEFEPTALQANSFTRDDYAFDCWNTEANGSGTSYFNGATVRLLDNLTLYAQWNPLFSVNCATVQHGSIEASHSTAVEGTLVTLTATPDAGYDFDYWVVTANNEPVEVEGNQFVMPASNVDVSAVFSYVGQTYTQKYYLVTDQSQLKEGRTYLIVCVSKNRAMGSQNSNNRGSVTVTISDNIITTKGNACEITLGTSGDYWTLYDPAYNGDAGGYLCAASSQNNYLMTQNTLDNNGKWDIVVGSDGTTLESKGSYSNKYLRYSSSGSYFGCFQNGQGTAVYLFIRSEECDFTESNTVACLNTFDKNTIHSGVALTAEKVLGKAMCNNASQLILEDGAQLSHSETGINATVKKTITAYSGTGGWYTIAAPFSSCTPSGAMIEGSYDLYAYDEDGDSQGKEWINYKAGIFNLASGQGYLYAHNPTTTLRMTGTLNSGTYYQTVNLSYGNSSEAIKGWNLLGNPTAHEISFTKTGSVSDGYYYLNNSNGWVYETGNSVPMGRGFLVKANDANQTVTLNPQSKGYREEKDQYLCLSVGDEKAYVKLNEGVSMPLLDLRGQHSSLYLMQDRKPYIMLVRDEAKTLDLCYEAHDHGTQTLTVDTKGLDLDYLHLIDHKTGADVDLLALRQAQGPASYTFEASKDDYATRFMLAFAPMDGPSTGSGAFAYWADGEIRLIIETQDFASLQVIDMMGRIIRCGDGVHTVSTSGMTPGVYVLRLVTDDNVRVQKIVVK